MSEYKDIVKDLMMSFHRFKQISKGRMQSPPDLKPSEMGLLFHISNASSDGVKVSDLSSMMHVTSPSITQLVTSLEEQGLVQRRMDRDDRRAVKVSLTEKGLSQTKKAEQDVMDMLSGLVEHLGPERSRELISIIDDIMEYFSNKKS